jgi:HK97 family phage prohead protease
MLKPATGETRDAFLARVLGDASMLKSHPDESHRRAIAETAWDAANPATRFFLDDDRPSGPREIMRLGRLALGDSKLETGEFEGVASVFGSLVDTFPKTRIMRGAFRQTLASDMERIRTLWQHNPDWLIGFPEKLEEREEGLYIKSRLSQDTQYGREALSLLKLAKEMGKQLDLSIGFDPVQWEMIVEAEGAEPVRYLRAVRLWEVSIVTWGADPLAKIVNVQSLAAAAARLPRGEAAVELWRAFRGAIAQEVHEGKVLSAKNRKLLEDAIAALQAVIAAADKQKEEEQQARGAGSSGSPSAIQAATTQARVNIARAALAELG